MKITAKALRALVEGVLKENIFLDDVAAYIEKAIPGATRDEIDTFTNEFLTDESLDGQLLADEIQQRWQWLDPDQCADMASDLVDLVSGANHHFNDHSSRVPLHGEF